jgi:hypothetical protein
MNPLLFVSLLASVSANTDEHSFVLEAVSSKPVQDLSVDFSGQLRSARLVKKAPTLLQVKTTVLKSVATRFTSAKNRNQTLESSSPNAGPVTFFQEESSVKRSDPEQADSVSPATPETPLSAPDVSSTTHLPSDEASVRLLGASSGIPQLRGTEETDLSQLTESHESASHWLRIISSFDTLCLTFGWFLLALTFLALFWIKERHFSGPLRDHLCREVARIPVSKASDFRTMFASPSAFAELLVEPSHSGTLSRIEGRVVASSPGLRMPLSGDDLTVFYSASVSQKRHDGIHQPPLAFHSAGIDFCIETRDGVRLSVRGEDISLFSMGAGLKEWRQAFSDAPASCRSFVVEHLVPSTDASMHFKKCLDLGGYGQALEFREAALLVGSTITAVGEVIREKTGAYRLCPWRPEEDLLKESSPKASAWFQAGLTSRFASKKSSKSVTECLTGSVFISDNTRLQGTTC